MKFLFRATVLAGLATAAAAQAQEQAIIVLDGSGSMWGQIDGRTKISIAQQVLGDVLATVPSSQALGLLVYGHREKGNCSDIELIIAPAPGATAEIVGTAKGISPKGKTPLSESVRQAAMVLRHEEEKATVIAITDGLETCGADPCALARELEASGVDFTAHVVGFGLSPEEGRQVACLAEETGGRYIQASDADGLADALSETVAAVAEPPPPVEEPAEPEALPTASLEAPESIEIGLQLDITWDGPGDKFDYVYLVDPDGNNGEGRDLRGVRLIHADFDNRRVRMTAPVTPGIYELQYRFDRRNVIATRAIEVVDAAVSLSAPPNADIGTTVDVIWIGPGGDRDTVQLFDPAAKQGEGSVLRETRLAHGDYEARSVSIILPAEPGFYQLRYWNRDDRKVLASREIEVLAAEVSLAAADSVDMGRTFDVSWVGPGARRDSVEIYDPDANNGDGKVVASVRLVNGDFDGRTVKLTAPTKTGPYQLRYWNGDSREVLATRPIEVVAIDVALSAPEAVDMGRSFEVAWIGPGANRDSVEIYDPEANNGNGKVVASVRLVNGDFEGRTVKLTAPTKAGPYELRYWNGDSREVLATRPVEVAAINVSVSAPEAVDMGRSFEVAWVGPGANRDSIEMFDPAGNNGNGKVVVSIRVVNGDMDNRTVKLQAPTEPGDYQLRYWSGVSRAVLATSPITVVATEVTLSAPESVDIGRTVVVAWVGPGANRDSVEIFDPEGDNGNGKVVNQQRLVNGDYDAQTVKLVAPVKPGDYLIRYWDGVGRKALATAPLAVVAAEVTITAPDSVTAAEPFTVEWVGPGANRDQIDLMSGDPVDGKSVVRARLVNGDYDGQTVKLKAPKEPGDYTLRYWNGDYRAVLATRPITVTE
ncbi:MAG: VWA domain-containing protein [Hyphomicrobiales bacterium]|nr:VWA domain-containing protein [Hyphomicrobiales bacterium]